MKNIIILLLLLNIISISSAQTPNWIWANQAIGNDISIGQDVTSDLNGNIYVCGYFMDSIQFGNQQLYSNDQRAYVVKYDSLGVFQWVNNFPCNNGSFANNISIDNQNNILISGYFSGYISLGGFSLSSSITNYFLVKVSSSGTVLWARQPDSDYHIQASSISIDINNNIYVTGRNYGITNFGDLLADKIGMFIVKYSPNGLPIQLINEFGCQPYSMNISNNNKIYLTGSIYDTTVIGNTTFYPTGYYEYISGDTVYVMPNDLFFICYNQSGTPEWIKQASSKSEDYWTYSCIDEYSNMYITGKLKDTTDFWGSILDPTDTSTPFMFKIDSIGNILWFNYGQPISSNSKLLLRDVIFDNNDIYVIGKPYGITEFSGLTIINNTDHWNSLIVKLDSNGNGLWQIIDTTNLARNEVKGITSDLNNNITICGFFEDSVHFGNHNLYSYGNISLIMFISKMLHGSITSLNNKNVNFSDIVFPNPNKGQFQIKFSSIPNQIKIFNTNGQVIKEIKTNNFKNSNINIDKNGLYYLQIFYNEKIVTRKVLVVK